MALKQEINKIPFHKHTGQDSPKINGSDLGGFKIYTSAPTHNAPEGTILLANESGTYKIYARINKGWRSATLT